MDVNVAVRDAFSFVPPRYASMPRAAACPLATASIIRRGPKAISPPANIPGAVVDKPFESTDRDGLARLDLAPAAGCFAGGVADTATDAREGVWSAGDEIGPLVVSLRYGRDVPTGVGVDRASLLAGNIPDVEIGIRQSHAIFGRIHLDLHISDWILIPQRS